jgi:Ca2+-binding RTX toxin-like protein
MTAGESIFTWEGISLPSYWGGNFQSSGGLAAMDLIKVNGANTISLVPNFFMADQYSNEVKLNLNSATPWMSESDTFAQVKQGIMDAVAKGLNVVVKPHVETDNRVWRALIEPTNPDLWFANYKAMMVQYAKAAQEAGAAMFCIGTEMRSMTDPAKVCPSDQTYTEKWGEIIDAVRAVFSGKLTYAATDDEALKLQFWDKLDYIGVDAYFSMAPDGTYNPTLAQLIDSWIKPPVNWNSQQVYGTTPVVDTWKQLSEKWGKKVIFTEIGYGSYDGTNLSPGWLRDTQPVDQEEQRLAYEALFHVMQNYGGQWLDGSLLWSYQTTTDPAYVPPTDYTTQGKPADAVIKAGYSSPEHVTGITRNGTAAIDKLDGGYHNDTLNGGGDNDVLWGGAGDDELNGGAGNDILDGATGVNTAVFSGARGDYSIVQNADGSYMITDSQAARDGSDVMRNVRYVKFNGQTFDLQAAGPNTPAPNPAPTALSLSQDFINEYDAYAGAFLGTAMGTDTDALKYSLSDSAGGLFTINETTGAIHLAGGLNFEGAPSHRLTVRAADTGGQFIEKSFTIRVIDQVSLSKRGTGKNDTFGGASGDDILKGSKGNDTLKGLAGDDRLYGELGLDKLTGGAGLNTFVFNTKPHSLSNKDKILDWSYKDDTIQLENAIFKSLKQTGMLNKASFVIGSKAKDGNDFIGYNKATGDLWYDTNGDKAGGQVVFAHIGKGKTILHSDFDVI